MAEFWICAITAHPWIMSTKQHLRVLGREGAEPMDLSPEGIAKIAYELYEDSRVMNLPFKARAAFVLTAIRDAATAAERERCALVVESMIGFVHLSEETNATLANRVAALREGETSGPG